MLIYFDYDFEAFSNHTLNTFKHIVLCTYVSLLHMKSDPYDMPPTSRSCGGQHTMTYAHRRTRISALRYTVLLSTKSKTFRISPAIYTP